VLGGEHLELLDRIFAQAVDTFHAAVSRRQCFPSFLEHPDESLLTPFLRRQLREEITEHTMHERASGVLRAKAGGNAVDVLVSIAEAAGVEDAKAQGRVARHIASLFYHL